MAKKESMRHADFSTAPLSPLAPTAATRPTAATGGGGAGFANMFGEVQGEVAAYIQHGDGAASGAATLSAEGSMWRARAAGLISGELGADGVEAPAGAGATS